MSLKCPHCGARLGLILSGIEPQSAPQIAAVEPQKIPQSRVGGIRSKARFNYEDPDFQAFYKHYPRKIGKGDAYLTFLKIAAVIEPQILIEGAMRFEAQCEAQKLDPKYIPYPARWLNAGRWDDEVPPDPADLAEKRAQAELERTRRFLDGDENAR